MTSPGVPSAVHRTSLRRSGDGFTLVELAVVLLVLGVLASTLLAPFGERLERRRHEESARRLDEVRRALVGHLVSRGALPCPLPGDGGSLDPGGGSAVSDGDPTPLCRRGHGHVPAAVLGVAGAVDADGALLDGWGRPLRYGVSLASDGRDGSASSPYWLVPAAVREVGLGRLAADLTLCRVAVDGACPRDATRAHALAFVVLSAGADASASGTGRENVDGDDVYALAPPSIAPGETFDDLLVWGSRDELAWWLLRAGWLP